MKKINTDELQIGMYVAQLDRPWLESPFMFQGFTVHTEEELEQLRQLCRFVYVDEDAEEFDVEEIELSAPAVADDEEDEPKDKAKKKKKVEDHPVPVENEIKAARKIRQQAQERFKGLLEAARLGKGLDVDVATNIVGDMVESLLRNPDALNLLRHIREHDSESESHAINTSILCLTFGRCLGLPSFDLKELGLAALLHDIGETEIPTSIIYDGPKNEEETALYNKHPEIGARILSEHGSIPKRVIDVAMSHHEQINGQGYPQALFGDEIDYFSRIVAIANVYDHITLGSSGPSLPPAEALRYLYLYRDKFFDSDLTERFIECLGVYPVGSLVEIATGEVAIVVSIPPESHLYPRLLLVRDAHKEPYQPPHIMNLAQFASSEHAEKYAIMRVLPDGSYGVDIKRYLKEQGGL